MRLILVNLKRFEISRKLGGVCSLDDPQQWIETVVDESVALGLGRLEGIRLVYLLPEALLLPAMRKLEGYPGSQTETLEVGSQGVFKEDIRPGGNFGAFTTHLPPTAARHLGCTWSIIGHSEERRDKLGLLEDFEPGIGTDPEVRLRAQEAIDATINREVLGALGAGLDVCCAWVRRLKSEAVGSLRTRSPGLKPC
jgi:triosephosphate isomerase